MDRELRRKVVVVECFEFSGIVSIFVMDSYGVTNLWESEKGGRLDCIKGFRVG